MPSFLPLATLTAGLQVRAESHHRSTLGLSQTRMDIFFRLLLNLIPETRRLLIMQLFSKLLLLEDSLKTKERHLGIRVQ
jgi:hypothetical protein